MGDPAELTASTAATSQQGISPTPPPSKETTAASTGSAPRIRRRNRVIASCLECRRRKLKCDKLAPCTNCTKFRRDCLYLANSLDSAAQQKLAEIKDRMGNLEQALERDVARNTSTDKGRRGKDASESEDDEEEQEFEDEKDLEVSPFAVLDQVYEDDADDDLMDLGVQLGKLRVSERVGGFVRPRMAEELDTTLGEARAARGQHQHLQRSSNPWMGIPDTSSASAQNWLLSDSPAAFLGPGPDYIAPASNFFFAASDISRSLGDFLPSRAVSDRLMNRYWISCHPIATVVHKPSFQEQYNMFWQHVMIGTEPPPSTQALVLACLFTAAVSLSNETAVQEVGFPRLALIERLQSGTEVCLAKANFLRTTKLETMQAFVMYLLPLCRAEISRAHSALTGTAIRLAECMGLHRDGSHYSFSPVETHVRRLVWYQLCFLDIRTCEATGPRPQIRRDDFDTKLPMNVNEEDLLKTPAPTEDCPYFTDMTLSRVRFETYEMHRYVWSEQPRIEQKKTKPTQVLHKVQKFRNDIEPRIMPLLNGPDPRQILALHLYRILSSRLYIMVLHRFFAGALQPMPDRLRRILIDACIATNEFTISLDTRPEISAWAWYRGAILQYHSAMLLLFEVGRDPSSTDVPRIWKCLDYVFELPPDMSNDQKLESVFFALRDRMSIYASMRKLKATKRADETLKSLVSGQATRGNTIHPRPAQVVLDAAAQKTAQMEPSQFSMPPLMSSNSHSESGSHSVPYGSNSPAGGSQVGISLDNAMQTSDDIWSDWDKIFQPDQQADFGAVDISDFNLGSFTSFVRPDAKMWPPSQ